MKIDHGFVTPDVSVDNSFVAYDDGKKLGFCTVSPRKMMLFPDCPQQYVLNAGGKQDGLPLLYGAAIAHARTLAMKSGRHARIYAEVDKNDKASMDMLRVFGFEEGDGLRRTYRPLNDRKNLIPKPENCIVLRDFIRVPEERRYFLDRYNSYYGCRKDETWLEEMTYRPDFARILLVSPDGLCGELLTWREDDVGVIGFVQTAAKWRRMGVASYLMEDARLYLYSAGLRYARFDVWENVPGCARLAVRNAYAGREMVKLYPQMYV